MICPWLYEWLHALFDSGQMPEHGEEILHEADEVPHAEIAAEVGVTPSVVRGRLFRMRARFRARLAVLGMLILLLRLFALLSRVNEVAAPAPETMPAEAAPPASSVPAWDGADEGSEMHFAPLPGLRGTERGRRQPPL